jgi:hypothetical protein
VRKIKITSVSGGITIEETTILGTTLTPKYYNDNTKLSFILDSSNQYYKDLGLHTYVSVTPNGAKLYNTCLWSEYEIDSTIPTNEEDLINLINGLIPFQTSTGGSGSTDLTPVLDKLNELIPIESEFYSVNLTTGNYDQTTILTGYTGAKTIINEITISPKVGGSDTYNFQATIDGNQTFVSGILNYKQSEINGDIGSFSLDVVGEVIVSLIMI